MASGTVRFGTYNLLDLFAADTAEHQRHYETVAGVIRDLAADVLAVQEILAPDAETAARRLRQLAGDAGLNCEVPGPGGSSGSEAAIAFGGHGYHVGLMWRDGIEPVPGSLRCYGGRDFWHGLALVTLDVGGPLIRHGAFHASPFGRRLRADQNERLVAAVTRPRGEPPVLVGADWNTESAEVTGATWQPTTGHHPSDAYGVRGVSRRIDAVRVTRELVPALRTHRVIDTARTRSASDHLPVLVEYHPSAALSA